MSSRRIRIGNRVVRLGGFAMPEANVVSFIDDTGMRRRIDVLVVDPDADPAFAERVLTLASTAGSTLLATEILSEAGAELVGTGTPS